MYLSVQFYQRDQAFLERAERVNGRTLTKMCTYERKRPDINSRDKEYLSYTCIYHVSFVMPNRPGMIHRGEISLHTINEGHPLERDQDVELLVDPTDLNQIEHAARAEDRGSRFILYVLFVFSGIPAFIGFIWGILLWRRPED